MRQPGNPLQNSQAVLTFLYRSALDMAARSLTDEKTRVRLRRVMATSALIVLHEVDSRVDDMIEWLEKQRAVESKEHK